MAPSFSLHPVTSEPPSSVSAQPQGSTHPMPFSLREHQGDEEFLQGPQTLGGLGCGTSAGDTRELRPSPRSSVAAPCLNFGAVTEASETQVLSVSCKSPCSPSSKGLPEGCSQARPWLACDAVASVPAVRVLLCVCPLHGPHCGSVPPAWRVSDKGKTTAGHLSPGWLPEELAGLIVTRLLLFSAGLGSCHRAISLPLSKLYMIIFDEHIPFISLDEMLK